MNATIERAMDDARELVADMGCTCGAPQDATHTCPAGSLWQVIKLLDDERRKIELGLRNTLTHARMLTRRVIRQETISATDLLHFVRFCKDAGVEPQILRGDPFGSEGLVCGVSARVIRATRGEEALVLEVQVDDPEAFLRIHAGSEVHVSIMVADPEPPSLANGIGMGTKGD